MIATNGRSQSLTIQCQMCGMDHSILVDPNDYLSWQSGKKYIQDALAYLSAAERELLISATCDDCWKSLYGEDE